LYDTTEQEPKQERPQLLTVLCILTFIGSGMSLLANGVLFLTVDSVRAAFDSGVFEMFEGSLEMEAVELLLNVDSLFFVAQAILYGFSLFGAIQMWNLRKTGFHIYTLAQISLLIVFNFFMSSLPFPVFPALISLIFILLYLRNLQFLR